MYAYYYMYGSVLYVRTISPDFVASWRANRLYKHKLSKRFWKCDVQ